MAGSKREKITIYEIAREAGVSPATVSRVLNETQAVSNLKKERILHVIEKYSFRPSAMARGLSGVETRVLGFIQPDISHPYYNALFLGAEKRAMELGYTLFLGNTLNDNMQHNNDMEIHYIQLMQEKHVDGVLIAGGRIHDRNVSDEYKSEFDACQAHTPIITVGGNLPWIDCPSVAADERTGISLIVEYLVSLNHKKIGFLGGAKGIEPTETRLTTFRSLLEEQGLQYHEEWHFESGFGFDDGRVAMEALLEVDEQPTAVLCFNDLVAIGAMTAAHKSGLRIPTDLSIAGIDNIAFGEHVYPPITTVDLRPADQGQAAVEAIIRIIGGDASDTHIIVEPRLALRSSCARP